MLAWGTLVFLYLFAVGVTYILYARIEAWSERMGGSAKLPRRVLKFARYVGAQRIAPFRRTVLGIVAIFCFAVFLFIVVSNLLGNN